MGLKLNELEVQLELLDRTRHLARYAANKNYEEAVEALPYKGRRVTWVQFTDTDTFESSGTVVGVVPDYVPATGNYAVFVRVESGGKVFNVLPHLLTF